MIGEILNAYRADLILPSDVGNTSDDVLLKIQEPKTRYRSARHQAGKLEQYDLIEIVRIGFGRLGPQEKLWHLSGATLRSRLTKLLSTLGLPHLPTHVPKALTLASFRPGGATHLIAVSESAELVRRRGRWASFRTMEMYLQEVAASTYMNEISETAKEKVLLAMRSWVSLRIQKHQPSLLPRQGLKLQPFSQPSKRSVRLETKVCSLISPTFPTMTIWLLSTLREQKVIPGCFRYLACTNP